jgi:exosortase
MSRHESRKADNRGREKTSRHVASPAAAGAEDSNFSSLQYRRTVVGLTLLLISFVWAYWPTLREIVRQWMTQPDYSHGFLVVPLSLIFLWSRRSQFPIESLRPSAYGALLLLFACVLRVGAGWFYLAPLDGWTIPIWIAGAVWLVAGWQCLLWSLPAIVFLWFMVPIPFTAESWFSVPLQAVATQLSTGCLVMLGQPALAEGNTIWLGDHQLFIEEACSGLRIFVGVFALAFAFVLFSGWTWWQKALALLAALPIAIVANTTRIVVTGLLFELASSETARRFSHDLSGLVMIPFAAALFLGFLIYLDRLFPLMEELSPVEASRLNRTS